MTREGSNDVDNDSTIDPQPACPEMRELLLNSASPLRRLGTCLRSGRLDRCDTNAREPAWLESRGAVPEERDGPCAASCEGASAYRSGVAPAAALPVESFFAASSCSSLMRGTPCVIQSGAG